MKLEIEIEEGGPLGASWTQIMLVREIPKTQFEKDCYSSLIYLLVEKFDDEFIEKHKDFEKWED